MTILIEKWVYLIVSITPSLTLQKITILKFA